MNTLLKQMSDAAQFATPIRWARVADAHEMQDWERSMRAALDVIVKRLQQTDGEKWLAGEYLKTLAAE